MTLLADWTVVCLPPEVVARLDPGGPDGPEEDPGWERLNEWDQEAFTPRARSEPAAADPPSLAAYAAHRERGLPPGAAAWAAVHGPSPEAEPEAEAG